MPPGHVPQQVQECLALQEQAVICGHGFDDDGGDGITLAGEEIPYGLLIIQGQYARGAHEGGRNTRGGRRAEGRKPGAGRHQQMIGVAVVAAGKFDDEIAPGGGARQADGAHGGLGARGHEPHLFESRIGLHHPFRQFHFRLAGRSKGRAGTAGLIDGLDDLRMRMPQDQRSPGTHEIDVAIAVNIENVRA